MNEPNILFLVGNGFDISVGLKTRYKDVLSSYLEHHLQSYSQLPSSFDFIIQDINIDLETWSKFEEKLAAFTVKINQENIQAYYDFLIDFRRYLVEYLLSEEHKINFSLLNITELEPLKKLIISGYIYFSEKSQQIITKYFNPYNNFPHYDFISFNYTRVLDECLKIIRTKTGPLKNGLASANCPDISDEILHIHGTLDAEVIMGVDNKNQIVNPGFRDDSRFIRTIIKPEVNNALENLKTDKAYTLINKSNIIVLFGMSIGSTDSSYWEKIGEWIIRDPSHQLLIFYILDEGDKIHPESKIANFDFIRDNFIRYAGNSDRINRKQIHVCYEADMFTLNLVKENV
jgi:hypothetical protein